MPTLATAVAFCGVRIPRTCSVTHLEVTRSPFAAIASAISWAKRSLSRRAFDGPSTFLRGFWSCSIILAITSRASSFSQVAIAMDRASTRVIPLLAIVTFFLLRGAGCGVRLFRSPSDSYNIKALALRSQELFLKIFVSTVPPQMDRDQKFPVVNFCAGRTKTNICSIFSTPRQEYTTRGATPLPHPTFFTKFSQLLFRTTVLHLPNCNQSQGKESNDQYQPDKKIVPQPSF